jgi:hypothetical protein
MRGAWQWPAFVVLTLADGFILHLLPPLQGGVDLVPGVLVASFGNLVLVGAVAPWLARRLAARERAGTSPPLSVIGDRVGTALLAAGTVAVLAAGLGSRPLIVSETERTERLAAAVRAHVLAEGSAEVRRNLPAANSRQLDEQGFFRSCIPLDDRTTAYCLFVDTETEPPTVTKDPDATPNARYFGAPPGR